MRLETAMPESLPKVSVVTVSFNAAASLQATIDSVAAQDYPHIEHIIIDGGSRDGTVQMIERNTRHLAYWVSEPDAGIYDAMNKGVARATGEWILFLNADDALYDASALRRVLEHPGAPSADKLVIYGDTVMQPPRGKATLRRAKPLRTIRFKMPFTHQGVLVRAELLRRRPFDTRYRIAADFDFFRDVYARYGQSAFLDTQQRMNYFRIGGASYKHLARRHAEFLDVIRRNETGLSRAYYTAHYVVRCLVPDRLREWAGLQ